MNLLDEVVDVLRQGGQSRANEAQEGFTASLDPTLPERVWVGHFAPRYPAMQHPRRYRIAAEFYTLLLLDGGYRVTEPVRTLLSPRLAVERTPLHLDGPSLVMPETPPPYGAPMAGETRPIHQRSG